MIWKITGMYKVITQVDTDSVAYKKFVASCERMHKKDIDVVDYAKYLFYQNNGVVNTDDMEWEAIDLVK